MLVTLEYPNGRLHETTIADENLEPGGEFDLYGRRWSVVAELQHGRRRLRPEGVPRRFLCRSTSKSPSYPGG